MTTNPSVPCSNVTSCCGRFCPPGEELSVLTKCADDQCPPSLATEVKIALPPDGPGQMLIFDPQLPWGDGS